MAPRNEFYSVKLRKKITIPTSNITERKVNGRKMLVGTYKVNGKTFRATKFA